MRGGVRRKLARRTMAKIKKTRLGTLGVSDARSPIDLRLAMFLAFLALVLLTGGGSRHDIAALVVLRPASAIFLALALIVGPLESAGQRGKVPFLLLGALAAVIAAQLIPLPPSVWQQLPGRGGVAVTDTLVGLPELWRPLSLTPGRTLNALLSLLIPAAGMALYSNLALAHRRAVLGLLIAGGALCVVWGLAQYIGGADSALYTYRVHTERKPIGLFANRNHTAMFLSLTIFFAVWYLARLSDIRGRRLLSMIGLASYCVVVILMIFILGSRAGLILCVLAVIVGAGVLVTAPWLRRWLPKAPNRPRSRWALPGSKALVPFAVLAIFLVLGGLAIITNRGEAFDRLNDGDAATPFDRSEVLPYLVRMAGDQWAWGSGFGSFDALFRRYESLSMLSTTYLNQAHNDWLQIVIEGGIPAVMVLGGFIAWLGWRATGAVRARVKGALGPQLALFASLGAIGFASLVDYPLRVPLLMLVTALIVCLLSEPDDFHAAATPRRRD